jgi:hypothetical protein
VWEKSVTKRETGFLLIGLGFGLMFAIAAIVELLLSLYRSAFISTYSWDKVFVLVPIANPRVTEHEKKTPRLLGAIGAVSNPC